MNLFVFCTNTAYLKDNTQSELQRTAVKQFGEQDMAHPKSHLEKLALLLAKLFLQSRKQAHFSSSRTHQEETNSIPYSLINFDVTKRMSHTFKRLTIFAHLYYNCGTAKESLVMKEYHGLKDFD